MQRPKTSKTSMKKAKTKICSYTQHIWCQGYINLQYIAQSAKELSVKQSLLTSTQRSNIQSFQPNLKLKEESLS